MENATEMHGWGWSGGVFGLIPVLILLALVVIPYWKIWQRTGHSGARKGQKFWGCSNYPACRYTKDFEAQS